MVEAEEKGPAMRALGSLLKLTEVFLCDDGTRNGMSFSLKQTKQKRKTGGKREGMRLKHPDTVSEALDSCKVSVEESVSPIVFDDNPSSSLCSMSMMGQSESSCSDVAVDATKSHCPFGEGDTITRDSAKEQHDGTLGTVSDDGQDCDSLHNSAVTRILASSTGLDVVLHPVSCSADAANGHEKTEPDERLIEHDHVDCSIMVCHEEELTKTGEDHVPEQPCVSESTSYSTCPEVFDNDGIDSQESGDFGDWMVYWDSYYMRNYFYNMKTHTSTWYPPEGMEHLDIIDTTCKSNEGVAEVTQMDVTTDFKTTGLCGLDIIESFQEPINDDAIHSQPYDELTVVNSMLRTSTSTVSVGIRHELQRNNSCNDENASCWSSTVHGHISSCRDQTMQLVSDEVCNNDLLARKSDEPYTCDIHDEPNEVHSCKDIPVYFGHDEAIQTLDTLSTSNSRAEEDDDTSMHSESGVPATDGLVLKSDCVLVKRKKKVRRIHSQGLLKECSADISKYWYQRYILFSRYDDGIKMDEEGWFSVTPEALARHHAQRCGSGIVIDCFTGVGGNAIQFAQISKHVTAIDIDPTKIDYAQHNAAIYGVHERIDFIKGDFFRLSSRLKADTVFLSPPWGGPDYAREETYDIMPMLKPYDGFFLFNTAKQVASKIVMFLPRNVDVNQLAELSLSAGTPPGSLEVEKNYVNGRLKGITAYFSDTAMRE